MRCAVWMFACFWELGISRDNYRAKLWKIIRFFKQGCQMDFLNFLQESERIHICIIRVISSDILKNNPVLQIWLQKNTLRIDNKSHYFYSFSIINFEGIEKHSVWYKTRKNGVQVLLESNTLHLLDVPQLIEAPVQQIQSQGFKSHQNAFLTHFFLIFQFKQQHGQVFRSWFFEEIDWQHHKSRKTNPTKSRSMIVHEFC